MSDRLALAIGLVAAAIVMIVRALRWALTKYQEAYGG